MDNENTNAARLAAVLSAGKGARFVTIRYTAKGTGDTARHLLSIGASLAAAYVSDIGKIDAALESPDTAEADKGHLRAIRESICLSLGVGIGNHPANALAGQTEAVCKGLRIVNRKDGKVALQIVGLQVRKDLIAKGLGGKVSKESPREEVKRRFNLATSKIRTFSVEVETLGAVRANGETVEIE